MYKFTSVQEYINWFTAGLEVVNTLYMSGKALKKQLCALTTIEEILSFEDGRV